MAASRKDTEQASPGFSSLHEEAILNLMRTADCLHRAFQLRLKPTGLTATQYNVLRILRGAQPNGLTCSAIGRRMITPEPDITRLLSRLKTQKLLTQQRDTKDRRVVWTRISERGLASLSALDGVVENFPKELLKKLTSEEVSKVTYLMKKIGNCGDITLDSTGHFGNDQNGEVTGTKVTAKLPSPRFPLRRPLE